MGCCKSRPEKSRNYTLFVRRNRHKYGFTVITVERFWQSGEFQTFASDYYKKNPEGDLVIRGNGVSDQYIDTWNQWRSTQSDISNKENLPYNQDFKSPYYPDMFNELLDLEFPPPRCTLDNNPFLCYNGLPEKHLRSQFNTVKEFYLKPEPYQNFQTTNYNNLDEYVNALLDYNEYTEIIRQIKTKYGEQAFQLDSESVRNKKIIV